MNPFSILITPCNNCSKNNLIFQNKYQCNTCKKQICKSCSSRPTYVMHKEESLRECFTCSNKTDFSIRKMIAIENGAFREFNIVKESEHVIYSAYFTTQSRAVENLKYISLLNDYNAITYLKTERSFLDRRKIVNFTNRKLKGQDYGYFASGILVKIEKKAE